MLTRAPIADIERLLRPILVEAIKVTHYEKGNIQLVDGRALSIVCQQGFDAAFLKAFERVDADTECACGRALKARDKIFIGDVENDERYEPYLPAALQAGYRSVLSHPIVTPDRQVLGVMSVHHKLVHPDPPPDIDHLSDFAAGLIARQSLVEIVSR